jgi:hypothetical protein
MTADAGKLSSTFPPSSFTPSSIVVGNGALLPVTATGSHTFYLPHHNLVLNDVLVSPNIIKNLISIRHFTTDNNCSIEFDPFGLFVKDLQTKNVIARCNSSGDLYPFYPLTTSTSAFIAAPTSLWHRRLGHPGLEPLSKLISSSVISCNKDDLHHICHACKLGRHTRLPFGSSSSRALHNFDLIHCDLWTSPIVSVSGYKYILLFLMIVRTTFGHFLSASNPRRFPHFQIFSLTFARNSAPSSRASSVITDVNLIILRAARSSSPTVLHSACRVHILLNKTVEQNVPFAP